MIMLMIALLTMIKFLPGADNGYDYTDEKGDYDDHHYHYDLGRRAESIVGTETSGDQILMRKIRMII